MKIVLKWISYPHPFGVRQLKAKEFVDVNFSSRQFNGRNRKTAT